MQLYNWHKKKKVKEQAVLRMTKLGATNTPAPGRNFTTQGIIPHHPDWQLLSFPGTLVVLIVWCGESGLGSNGSPDLWVMDKWGGVSLWAGWLRPTGVLRALCWPSQSLVKTRSTPSTSTGRSAASKRSTVGKASSLKPAHPSSSKRALAFLSQTL